MPKKQNPCELRTTRATKKLFFFLTFLCWIFFHKFLTKFLNISGDSQDQGITFWTYYLGDFCIKSLKFVNFIHFDQLKRL
jgi:hypothetical protein